MNYEYFNREGAYIVPIKNRKIAVVKLPKGLFLLGGKIEEGESHKQCICRECLEEIGYTVEVGRKIDSSETYIESPNLGHFHPIQHYYSARLIEKVSEPVEKDHALCWIDYEDLKGKMFSETQNWAIDMAMKQVAE